MQVSSERSWVLHCRNGQADATAHVGAEVVRRCQVSAVSYLHASNIHYRDIKPENMLVQIETLDCLNHGFIWFGIMWVGIIWLGIVWFAIMWLGIIF